MGRAFKNQDEWHKKVNEGITYEECSNLRKLRKRPLKKSIEGGITGFKKKPRSNDATYERKLRLKDRDITCENFNYHRTFATRKEMLRHIGLDHGDGRMEN